MSKKVEFQAHRVEPCKAEKISIDNNEALFFYDLAYIGQDTWEIVRECQDVLVTMGNNNHGETGLGKEIESIQAQFDNSNFDKDNSKIRLNCPFTGKFEWVDSEFMPQIIDEMVDQLFARITEAYGLENYTCGYFDGSWGMFPINECDY